MVRITSTLIPAQIAILLSAIVALGVITVRRVLATPKTALTIECHTVFKLTRHVFTCGTETVVVAINRVQLVQSILTLYAL
eukprot:scaffold661721_cov169-Attheya_sp.AAC.1